MAYPNPILTGGLLTLDGTIIGSPIYVYNHLGACVLSIFATGSTMNFTLNLPQGIYLMRNENRMVRVIIGK
jgi:hypothetical protein